MRILDKYKYKRISINIKQRSKSMQSMKMLLRESQSILEYSRLEYVIVTQ